MNSEGHRPSCASDVLTQALKDTFVGNSFLFGFKTVLALKNDASRNSWPVRLADIIEKSQPLSNKHMNVVVKGQPFHLVAYQMVSMNRLVTVVSHMTRIWLLEDKSVSLNNATDSLCKDYCIAESAGLCGFSCNMKLSPPITSEDSIVLSCERERDEDSIVRSCEEKKSLYSNHLGKQKVKLPENSAKFNLEALAVHTEDSLKLTQHLFQINSTNGVKTSLSKSLARFNHHNGLDKKCQKGRDNDLMTNVRHQLLLENKSMDFSSWFTDLPESEDLEEFFGNDPTFGHNCAIANKNSRPIKSEIFVSSPESRNTLHFLKTRIILNANGESMDEDAGSSGERTERVTDESLKNKGDSVIRPHLRNKNDPSQVCLFRSRESDSVSQNACTVGEERQQVMKESVINNAPMADGGCDGADCRKGKAGNLFVKPSCFRPNLSSCQPRCSYGPSGNSDKSYFLHIKNAKGSISEASQGNKRWLLAYSCFAANEEFSNYTKSQSLFSDSMGSSGSSNEPESHDAIRPNDRGKELDSERTNLQGNENMRPLLENCVGLFSPDLFSQTSYVDIWQLASREPFHYDAHIAMTSTPRHSASHANKHSEGLSSFRNAERKFSSLDDSESLFSTFTGNYAKGKQRKKSFPNLVNITEKCSFLDDSRSLFSPANVEDLSEIRKNDTLSSREQRENLELSNLIKNSGKSDLKRPVSRLSPDLFSQSSVSQIAIDETYLFDITSGKFNSDALFPVLSPTCCSQELSSSLQPNQIIKKRKSASGTYRKHSYAEGRLAAKF